MKADCVDTFLGFAVVFVVIGLLCFLVGTKVWFVCLFAAIEFVALAVLIDIWWVD